MTREAFWKLIESARGSGDVDESVEAVADAVRSLDPQEIVDFDRHLYELMAASYSWDIWGAAYLINGGCSDDGFDYFRGWLILQGQGVFEQALRDPDSLADLEILEEDVECEDLLYVAYEAYEAATGKEIPAASRADLPELGEDWDFDDDQEMKKRYPKLFARFGN